MCFRFKNVNRITFLEFPSRREPLILSKTYNFSNADADINSLCVRRHDDINEIRYDLNNFIYYKIYRNNTTTKVL